MDGTRDSFAVEFFCYRREQPPEAACGAAWALRPSLGRLWNMRKGSFQLLRRVRAMRREPLCPSLRKVETAESAQSEEAESEESEEAEEA